MTPQISVSTGIRIPATVVSRSACSIRNGATGRKRIASLTQASTYSSRAKSSIVHADGSPTRSSISARARARQSGCSNSSQIAQASEFAVVSSPASSIVSTLPWTSLGVIPDCGSSAATIIASSRFFGAARRAGSSSRCRAAAMKPWIAAATAATLRSSSRSAADFHQRQVGTRGEHAPKDGREDLVEMLLDDVGVRLEGVDLGAEGQTGDGVDGVAHQVGLEVDASCRRPRRAPAPGQALADGHERREVSPQMARIESRHDHPALPLPRLAFGAEHADRRADLGRDLGQLLGAAKAVGPVAQEGAHRRVVGDRQDAPVAELEAEVRPVFLHPALDLLMDAGAIDLEQVADERQARGRRQLVDLAQARGRQRAGAVSVSRVMTAP